MFKNIIHELSLHSPFTLLGAMSGIILMMVFKNLPYETAHTLFYILHPAHIFLSAIVMTAVYCHYKPKTKNEVGRKFWKVLLVGFVGSVGIGTLSDSIIPFWGEMLMEMPHAEHHIGFIEQWWLVNPIALAGILIGYFFPFSKFPHAGHVLVSTWASLFHMFMAGGQGYEMQYFGIFIFLFLAVWLPCCLSDIVFPLLFVKDKDKAKEMCRCSCHL